MLMKKLRPMTPHEHLAFGAELTEIEWRLTAAWFAVEQSYGRAAGNKFRTIVKRLELLRSEMDGRVCSEVPREVNAIDGVPVTRAYYGWREGPRGRRDLEPINNARDCLAATAEQVFSGGNPWREKSSAKSRD